jgi:hypothetical protein
VEAPEKSERGVDPWDLLLWLITVQLETEESRDVERRVEVLEWTHHRKEGPSVHLGLRCHKRGGHTRFGQTLKG